MKTQTLKKIVFIVITLVILAGQSLAGEISKETASKIRETIQTQVKHPGYSTVMENICCADIIFTITENGKLIVKRIITDNEALSGYLIKKLSHIRFDKTDNLMKRDFRIKLSFRLI